MVKAIDPGHSYLLDCYDSKDGRLASLHFMKREGNEYPGNVGHHSGPNCQEVIRALIDRVKYLDKQDDCPENKDIVEQLRFVLWLFERRAARRRGHEQPKLHPELELEPACPTCGHVQCRKEHK